MRDGAAPPQRLHLRSARRVKKPDFRETHYPRSCTAFVEAGFLAHVALIWISIEDVIACAVLTRLPFMSCVIGSLGCPAAFSG